MALERSKVVLLSLFLCYFSLALATTFDSPNECQWAYRDTEEWSTLCGGTWSVCGNGEYQSPVNIINYQFDFQLMALINDYRQRDVELVNTGHIIQIQAGNQSMGTLSTPVLPTMYNLVEVQFHSPAEHLVDNVLYSAEIHYIHRAGPQDPVVIIGIIFELSLTSNPELQIILDQLKYIPNEFDKISISFNPSVFLPIVQEGSQNYFHYVGSLTAPPCSEGVYWFIYEQRQGISLDQVKLLFNLFKHKTNRPPQNIYARAPIRYFTPISSFTKPYTVQIRNGFSSADLMNHTVYEGSLVHIWAFTQPDQLFERWQTESEKDMKLLASRTDYYTVFRMPARSVRFVATYKPSLPVEFNLMYVNDLPVYYHIPRHHSGVIFWFHGDGEKASDYVPILSTSVEKQFFTRNLISSTFGVVIYEACCLSSTGQSVWNTKKSLNNTDVKNVEKLIDVLIEEEIVVEEDTMIAAGLGAGGEFAISFGIKHHFEAVISFGAVEQIDPRNTNVSTIPRLFLLSANDPNRSPQEIFELVEHLENISIHAQYYVKQPTPLHPLIFTRIQHVTQEESIQITKVFLSKGLLDPVTYYFIRNPLSNESISQWGPEIPTSVPFNDVYSIVKLSWAGHTVFDEVTNGIIIHFLSEYAYVAEGEGWVIAGILIAVMILTVIMYAVCSLSKHHPKPPSEHLLK